MRCRLLLLAAVLAAATLTGPAATADVAATAVPTYESVGLYWAPADGSDTNAATTQYRKVGTSVWKTAQPLWYDARTVGGRTPEYRGSIVGLKENTTYDVRITLTTGTTTTIQAKTWKTAVPIASTVTVPSGGPLTITTGGTPTGYVVYQAASTGSTITAAETDPAAITVAAPYVIVRNFTVVGGDQGILLDQGAHDVQINRNDITGWGPTCPTPGACGNMESGVSGAAGFTYSRVTVQRNKIHDPHYSANTWPEAGHPKGPQGITLPPGSTNNVFRYNEITSSPAALFNDSMGNLDNFSTEGFPQADSDVYGNLITYTADDGLEMEGADMNVRVYGNFIDHTFTGVASASVSVGPLYVFRNVTAHSDNDPRDPAVNGVGQFAKVDDSKPDASGGRRYVLNNTLLQPSDGAGIRGGIQATGGSNKTILNTVSRNNLWNAPNQPYVYTYGTGLDFDYDLSWIVPNKPVGPHHVTGTPVFAAGGGDDAGSSGLYALDPTSPGFDAGAVLPGFTDGFTGAAPDIGAMESGAAPMQFGVNAYS